MPLILETGAMAEGANAYASVAEVDAWQGARAAADWPAPPAEGGDDPETAAKEAAIIKATDYLNGLSWRGKRAAGGRLMAWPRVEAEDADGYPVPADTIPEAVKAACCYLAGLSYAGTDLQPVLERGGRIQSKSLGDISKSFFEDAACRDIYAALADMLRGLAYGLDDYAGAGAGPGTSKTTVIPLVIG